jgi:hypothetical protein
MVRRRTHPSRASDSEAVANGAIKRHLRTMLRIAGRTMRPQPGRILNAAKMPLLRMGSMFNPLGGWHRDGLAFPAIMRKICRE